LEENMEENTPNAEAAPAADGDQVTVSDSILQLEAIAAERDRLEQENNDLNQRTLRLAAEFDNYRKRTEREKSELLEYGAEGAVRAMLPILDDFERALQAEPPESEYTRGVWLIHQRMAEGLAKLGLESIDAEGKPFDPNLHNAIDRVESADVEEDTVACVYQRGYLFKGRLLRAAMVRVAVKQ
jgi:molecular chaperone GrpE